MIELQYNFPLLPGQGAQWRERLLRAVESLARGETDELRPTFRSDHSAMRAVLASWVGAPMDRTWITCGGHHGTLIAMLASELAGKILVTEEVTYTAALVQAKMLGTSVVGCRFDDEGMLPDALRGLCTEHGGAVRAIFVMPTVHNPLGCVASLARREAIVAAAREFSLVIIEDDAYGFMEPNAPPSYAQLAPERTFYVRGLSKVYAPATRTGILVAPEIYAAAVAATIKNTTTGTSLPHNLAAVSLVEDGSVDAVIADKRAEGARRNAAARAVLGRRTFAGAAAAWHLWVTIPRGIDAAEFESVMAKREVAVSGGQSFAVPPHKARGVRLALGGELDAAWLLEGVKRVAELCDESIWRVIAE
jgi:DNA-binding transcriptional MocR family regulator